MSLVASAVDVLETQILEPLVGARCAQALLALDYENVPCLKLLVSKGLGLGIIAGSAILKVPQIAKILQLKSAEGISLSSYLLETLTFVIGLAYNVRQENPFSTYGEGAFILLQNLFIIWLMLGYQGSSGVLIAGLFGALGAMGYSLLTEDLVSSSLLLSLQWGTVFLGILSKLPQILSNFQARSVGALSPVTLILQFAGTLARVFTTLQEVKDSLLLISFAIGAALNGILVLQWALFSKKSKAKPKAKANDAPKTGSHSRKKMA